jgi:hypothetical protein
LARQQGRGPLVVRAALLVLLARPIGTTVLGQEAIRMSLAGAQAAQGHAAALSTPGYYNIQVGPTFLRFGAGLGLEYNDNITIGQNGQEGDFIYSPSITAHLLWPITQIQSLNVTIGGGYSGYVEHPSMNRPYITPDSEVAFNIYVGDFVINLHDRFSITENSYQDPTVVGSGTYSAFQNAAGVSAIWDLNKVIVNFGYDYADTLELSGGQGQAGGTSDIFSTSAGYTLKPGMLLGVEAGAAVQQYSTVTTNNPYTGATEWNVGPFFQTPVTAHLVFRADAGYIVNSPDGSGALPSATAFNSYYGTISLTHRLNRFVQYSVSGGRSLSTTLFGGAVDSYTANLSANWKIFQKVSLTTSFVYIQGTQVGVAGGETFDQYGPDIRLGRGITKKLSSSLDYQHLDRSSNLPGRGYTLNVVSLNLAYQF